MDAPYGSFSIDRHPAPSYVFVVGGIGIVPIMAMLRSLAYRRDKRPLLLIYGYSTWDRLTFREDLADIENSLNLKTVVVLKDPPEDWEGETGIITEEILTRHLPAEPMTCEYFICGPVPMINAVEIAYNRRGIPLRQIHSELFDLV